MHIFERAIAQILNGNIYIFFLLFLYHYYKMKKEITENEEIYFSEEKMRRCR